MSPPNSGRSFTLAVRWRGAKGSHPVASNCTPRYELLWSPIIIIWTMYFHIGMPHYLTENDTYNGVYGPQWCFASHQFMSLFFTTTLRSFHPCEHNCICQYLVSFIYECCLIMPINPLIYAGRWENMMRSRTIQRSSIPTDITAATRREEIHLLTLTPSSLGSGGGTGCYLCVVSKPC